MTKKIQIMLVEDHPDYREVIELSLLDEPDMQMISKFGAAEVALRSLEDRSTLTKPDVILLDINLPGMSGIKAIPWIKKYSPTTKVIMLTQSDMEADVVQAIQSGAAGYLLKSASIEEITQGIRTVMANGASLDASVARYLVLAMREQPTVENEVALTNREMEILSMLAEGLVKKQIADQLSIGIHTVAEHVKRIYTKLEVQNAPSAIHKAHHLGIFRK
ncbi:MAG: LuxR family transcriptional regulator [Opitutaceae bacterium BACL24 MAG-120322-bin51]|jgi:DNA-binding NarL/FixJ family response regulator|nr:MAG: LuxR family transcriptional regulator [Opitutaceae bacterium BACL24 MAG-120322-bin51]